ncbi:MAG: exodeoxyribonuclease V subunit alpha [Acidimicrobiia bacterium]
MNAAPVTDRLLAATESRSTVVATHGLLAAFNDAGVLAPIDILAAQTIARLLGETDQQAVLAAALTIRGTRFGHVCIDVATLREAVVVDGQEPEVVDSLPWPDPEEWSTAIAGSVLVGDGAGDEPLALVDGRLYLERYLRYEEQIAGLLTERLRRPTRSLPPAAPTMLDRLLGPDAVRQRQAVVQATTGDVTVIAGGPGTGKTFTIGALLATLATDASTPFPLVAVCAPTGKAAARVGEGLAALAARVDDPLVGERLLAVDPSTIHRLLGWSRERGRFAHDARQRLPHDLVIVDEMSMVSLPMAAKLLQAVRDDASVVLVGDPFQLESIEAGTVLADIAGPAVEPGSTTAKAPPIAGHVVVLDRVHRFGEEGVIADFTDAVRRGDADTAVAQLAGGHDELRWVEDRAHPAFGPLWDDVVEHRTRLVELAASGDAAATLAALPELAVLCARREGRGGVSRWRQEVEPSLDERFPGLRYKGEWYPGRPVMITRNDRTLELYNGDIGVCVATPEGLRAVFDRGGLRMFPLSHLGEHTTVHAMTIHKSQGSQFGSVVVVLPGEPSPFVTRQLLYTAATRASDRVWVVADEATVRDAVTRSVQRASGLRERLWDDRAPQETTDGPAR